MGHPCCHGAGKTEVKCFANFSHALLATKGADGKGSAEAGTYRKVVLDYSKQALTTDTGKQQSTGQSLGKLGQSLEQHFGGPQDVEGAIQNDQIYVVQTRPQP